MNTVSLYGPFPPNIGGVSIHLERLAKKLERDGMLSAVYVNNYRKGIDSNEYLPFCKDVSFNRLHKIIGKIYWPIKFIAKDSCKVVHIHGSVYWDLFAVILILKFYKRKVVFTLHDQMQLNRKYSFYWVLRSIYTTLSRDKNLSFIAVSEHIQNQLLKLGISEDKIRTIPAYLAPEDNQFLDEEILQFKKGKDLLTVYAHNLCLDNSVDIYGVDLILSVFNQLVEEFTHIVLLICITGSVDQSLKKKYFSKINPIHRDKILFFERPVASIMKLWKESKIYIRPTRTDGDSVAVREALSMGTTVLASDCTMRPEGCVLFRADDSADMLIKLKKAMTSDVGKSVVGPNNYKIILDIYAIPT